jgi:hypothetical protein
MTETNEKRSIKGAYAALLLILGLAAIVGLFFLMVHLLDRQAYEGGSSYIVKIVALAVGVSSALFVFGLFLGYFYRNPKAGWLQRKKTREHFQSALEFERGERIRLEKDLYESKQTIAGLRDKVTELQDAPPSAPPPEVVPKEPVPLPQPIRESKPEITEAHLKEIETLKRQHDQLQNDLSLRKARIADLLAEIAMAQTEAEQARAEVRELRSSKAPLPPTLQTVREDASLKELLGHVTTLEGIQMALVADDYGLVVETAGNDIPSDKLAAVSSLLYQIGNNVEDIFAMGKLKTVTLGDESGFVLENVYFDLFTLRCALTIARDAAHPYPGLAEQTIEAIISRLKE